MQQHALCLSLCRNVAYFQSTCYKTKAFTSSACNQPPCSHWFTFPYFTFKIKMKIEIKIKLIELFHFIFHEIWIRIEHEFNYTHVILTGQNSDDSSKLWIFTRKWDNSLLQLKWHFRVENCHLKFAQSLYYVCTIVACFAAARLNSSQWLALFQLSIVIKMNTWKPK